MNCKNKLIIEKCPASAIMDLKFCWVEMDLFKTQGDISGVVLQHFFCFFKLDFGQKWNLIVLLY